MESLNFSKIFALFPGQGSQSVGMGKGLASRSKAAASLFKRANQALNYDISNLCFNGPIEELTKTENAQPAILITSIAVLNMWEEEGGDLSRVLCSAGHSLGEYSALVAAGSLNFEDAVILVNKRGRYMQNAVGDGEGKMIAVLGKEVGEIESCISGLTKGVAEIANINAPGQIVVAGTKEGVSEFQSKLGKARVIELQVSAPFHSSLMRAAAENLRVDLANIEIKAPRFPVIQNFTACATSNPDEIRENLYQQVCGRVRWVECVTNGISQHAPEVAVEFGAGNVLSGLLKKIEPTLSRHSTQDLFGEIVNGLGNSN